MWGHDIRRMHEHYGVGQWVATATPEQRQELIKLRLRMLIEEHGETLNAYLMSDGEEFVDGLIDLCVIAIGTLDIMGVDPEAAWGAVLAANMAKRPGVKPGRPNPLGLPDLLKPAGWTPPDHSMWKDVLND